MENILFSINAVLPIFLVIFMGYILKKIGLIDDLFVKKATQLVFRISLPCLVFQSVRVIKIEELFTVEMAGLATFSILATIGTFLVTALISLIFVKNKESRGPFVQGVFRSNFVIIGFSIIENLFDETGLAKAGLLTAFIMPLFNILAVIALTIFLPKDNSTSKNQNNFTVVSTLINIIKNPLIIAIILALIFAFGNLGVPIFLDKTIDYTGQLAMPLSLICIGAFFKYDEVKGRLKNTIIVTVLKMVISPILLITIAYIIGFRGEYLGILMILFTSPTAVSSFAMAEAMDNDSHLAASIVIMTTACSIISIFVGINVLNILGLISF